MIECHVFEPYEGEPDKERLRAAFKRRPLDRVPHLDGLIEEKHVEKILGRYAGNTLAYGSNPAKGAGSPETRPMYPEDYIELCKIIGQDAIKVTAGFWTPFKKQDEDNQLVQVADKSVKNRKDFDTLVLDSDAQIDYALKYVREYKDALEKSKNKMGLMVTYGAIMQTLYEFVIGMNDFMIMTYEDIGLINDMLEVSTEHFHKMTKTLVEEEVDFIGIADDVAFKTGLFIPPKIMKEIWVPRIARIIKPALDREIPVFLHSDGKIDDLVDDLIEIGIDCINPLDPSGVDYRDYKKRFGNRISFYGNIDIEFPLSKGTPEDVERDVKEHMEVLKPGYGYISGSSHSIVDYIPHENYIAYINTVHKYGKY